jgi:hypothetical protein
MYARDIRFETRTGDQLQFYILTASIIFVIIILLLLKR